MYRETENTHTHTYTWTQSHCTHGFIACGHIAVPSGLVQLRRRGSADTHFLHTDTDTDRQTDTFKVKTSETTATMKAGNTHAHTHRNNACVSFAEESEKKK